MPQEPLTAPSTPAVREAATIDRPWAIQSLPPFPAVALQLMSVLDDEDVPMKQVVELLRVDPALSAEILRVSNSAYYGLSRQIDSVSHAVVVLGTQTVKRLAMTAALGKFAKEFMHNESLRTCWDHSIACAMIAEKIAELVPAARDRCYTAGLLHDVGRLALLACHPNEYGGMLAVARENDFDELECERQLFDADHCNTGAYLAHQWQLPEDIAGAIAYHHDPSPADGSTLAVTCAASLVADHFGYAVIEREGRPALAESLAAAPVPDMDKAVEEFADFGDKIEQAISSISPS